MLIQMYWANLTKDIFLNLILILKEDTLLLLLTIIRHRQLMLQCLRNFPNTHSFVAAVKDEFPEFSYPAASELILKEGARVMFVKNDLSRDKLFFNGKIGTVLTFEDDIIVVKCADDDFPIRLRWRNGKTWNITLDEMTREIQETIIGTFYPIPSQISLGNYNS